MSLYEIALIVAAAEQRHHRTACKKRTRSTMKIVLSITIGAILAAAFVVATSPKLQSVLGLSF